MKNKKENMDERKRRRMRGREEKERRQEKGWREEKRNKMKNKVSFFILSHQQVTIDTSLNLSDVW